MAISYQRQFKDLADRLGRERSQRAPIHPAELRQRVLDHIDQGVAEAKRPMGRSDRPEEAA